MFWFLFFWLGVYVRATRSNVNTKPKKETIREYEWSAFSSVAVATELYLLRLSSPLPVAKQVEGEFEGAEPTQLVQRMHTSAFDLPKKNRRILPFSIKARYKDIRGWEVIIMFSNEEIEKIHRALSVEPNFETKSGFTGNKKKNVHIKIGQKRRKTDHLTNKERKKLASLHKKVDEIFISISHVSRKEEGKVTKKDMQKGKNRNEGAYGVHSNAGFEKYKKMSKTVVKYCFEKYGINSLNDIKPGMYISFIEDMTKGIKVNGKEGETFDYSPKTIANYITSVEKMCEGAKNADCERLAKLSADNVRDKVDSFRKKYSKKEYKRGKNVDGRLGYQLREAQTIAKKAHELSPYYGTMFDVLTYASPRVSELRKIKWRQLDLENNRIYLDDPNQTKGARPRFVPIPEKVSQRLQALKDVVNPSNLDSRIWGKNLSEGDVRNLAKHCCSEGKVGYSGIHDFRRAAVEYHQRELKKQYKKGTLTKEQLVDKILDQVSADPKLNPMVPQMKKVNGKWIETGEMEPRYTKEKLMGRRIDFLMNSYIAQLLGHNRTDSTSPYKNG